MANAWVLFIYTLFHCQIAHCCLRMQWSTTRNGRLTQKTKSNSQICDIEVSWRFDCGPDAGKSKVDCLRRGCCWNPSKYKELPSCFYSKNFTTYYIKNTRFVSKNRKSIDIIGKRSKMRATDIKRLRIDITQVTDSHLNIKIYDPRNERWEVPLDVPLEKTQEESHGPNYVVEIAYPFSIIVKRAISKQVLFNTSVGALVFADQFLQWSSILPSRYVYGLGVHGSEILRSTNWTRYTLWNKDFRSKGNTNLYGSHPFYLAMDEPGNFHGVFLLNSNAMEVILQPANAVTWRTIGGVLDFHIFTGPAPADVVEQYTKLIGRPFMPPYWSFGFHLCRWGYKTSERTLAVLERNRRAGVPLEVQWNDIEYAYERLDFTYDSKRFGNLPDLVEKIHKLDMHYMLIFDAGISNNHTGYRPYDAGLNLDIFIKNYSGGILVGKVWPGTTVFPDFTNPKTMNYWSDMVADFHQEVPFDGMWIDMNEISNFVIGSVNGCPKDSKLENPPYLPRNIRGGCLRFYTICASAQHFLSSEYNVHSLYGLTEARASYNSLVDVRKKRPFIISRSSFPGTGQWAGIWTGDNFGTFFDLKASVASILTMNVLGIPVVGADICGFHNNTEEELCARWHQLGAFYPFMRNHNDRGNIPQDPAAFEKGIVNTIAHAISIRYCLLPYIYTLAYKSHQTGETIVRPMFFEWRNSSKEYIYQTSSQFMIGASLLFAPVTSQHTHYEANSSGRYYTTTYRSYFPRGIWYQYLCPADSNDREIISIRQDFEWKQLNSTISTNESIISQLPVYVRPGSILPSFFAAAPTATKNRKLPFALIVGLDEQNVAKGDIYWDDGDTILPTERYNYVEFFVSGNSLRSTVVHYGFTSPMPLNQIRVFPVYATPTIVKINEAAFDNWVYNDQQAELVLNTTQVLRLATTFHVKWQFI